jgi:hypothetical protein
VVGGCGRDGEGRTTLPSRAPPRLTLLLRDALVLGRVQALELDVGVRREQRRDVDPLEVAEEGRQHRRGGDQDVRALGPRLAAHRGLAVVVGDAVRADEACAGRGCEVGRGAGAGDGWRGDGAEGHPPPVRVGRSLTVHGEGDDEVVAAVHVAQVHVRRRDPAGGPEGVGEGLRRVREGGDGRGRLRGEDRGWRGKGVSSSSPRRRRRR